MIFGKTLKTIIVSTFILLTVIIPVSAQNYAYIDKLFDLRQAISSQGKTLPQAITQTSGNDLRTLERIFELNNSALTTIEAYFRVFKIAIAVNGKLTPDSVNILNEWLDFMRTQCIYDKDFLEEALETTKNNIVIKEIKTAKTNIEILENITSEGITENNNAVGQ